MNFVQEHLKSEANNSNRRGKVKKFSQKPENLFKLLYSNYEIHAKTTRFSLLSQLQLDKNYYSNFGSHWQVKDEKNEQIKNQHPIQSKSFRL